MSFQTYFQTVLKTLMYHPEIRHRMDEISIACRSEGWKSKRGKVHFGL